MKQEIDEWMAFDLRHKLNALPSALIDYRFTFNGKMQVQEGEVTIRILDYVDETKKKQLLERIPI